MGDMDLREGVELEGRSVPLRFASARGSMLLRLRAPPRGTMVVSTEYEDSGSHLFSLSQLQ